MQKYKVSIDISFLNPSDTKGRVYVLPYKDDSQKILSFDLSHPSFCKTKINQDKFKNEYLEFRCSPSDDFLINVEYEVEVNNAFSKFNGNEKDFLSSSKYVDLEKFQGIQIQYSSMEDLINKVIGVVRGSMKYDKNNVKVKSAFGSLLTGSGVCVNFSHVALGIFRSLGIPARYVIGLTPFFSSTKEAHAWVEIKVNDYWLPVDPTNGLVGLKYLKWAIGRDDSDVRTRVWYHKPTVVDFSFKIK